MGIALLGTWLPNLLGKSDENDWTKNNEYPVPVLTAIGEIDGGGISYLRREVEETNALSNSVKSFTKTIMVPQVIKMSAIKRVSVYIGALRYILEYAFCILK